MPTAEAPSVPARAAVADILGRVGVVADAEALAFEPLEGGVSADLWRVRLGAQSWCAKQPRERLKVARNWMVSRTRAGNEVRWLATARTIAPEAVPVVIGYDAEHELFVMRDYAPPAWTPWKGRLLSGRIEPDLAAALGSCLGRIHADTAHQPGLAGTFAGDLFEALRVGPFFRALLPVHDDLAPVIEARMGLLRSGPRALVHGDVSPKNVLVGPGGRLLLLDAECACWGLPAFDAAFLLHHLMLKGAARPERVTQYLEAGQRFFAAWSGAAGSAAGDDDGEERTTALIPILLLARIDGTSPVDYLDAAMAARVRAFARTQLRHPPQGLAQLGARWTRAMAPLG
jgi:aminoglycoside phosphotransferase (APT) family kinase protein